MYPLMYLPMLDDWLKNLEPISWMEIGVYTAVVIISLLTCYMVGVSIFVTGTPWNAEITDNVLNWLQLIATAVIILELERIWSHCCEFKRILSSQTIQLKKKR